MKTPTFISNIVRKLAGLPGPGDDFWYQAVGQTTHVGIKVTPDSALASTAVYACVRLMSETMGSLPLLVYRLLEDGGKERAPNHPISDLLRFAPNRWQTAVEWIEMMQGHLELYGNAYSEIIEGPRGFADQLIPLHPNRIEVRVLPNRKPLYLFRERAGGVREIDSDQMFHLRGWGSNGYVGISPIALAAEAIGLSLAAQGYGGRFFQNDATPGGTLETEHGLDERTYNLTKESWKKEHAGFLKSHNPVILQKGLKYKHIGLTNKDAQFIEARKFQAEEIARIFHVPAHKIGLMEAATFSNIEQQAIEFVIEAVIPRARLWEQTIKRDLIIAKRTFFAEFLLDGLLRGDTKTRFEAYKIALGGGGSPAFMTQNEVRARENLNRIDDESADKLHTPVNVQPFGVTSDDAKRLAAFMRSGADGGDNGRED